MKTILSIAIATMMAVLPVMAADQDSPGPSPTIPWPCLIVLGIEIVTGTICLYAMTNKEHCCGNHKLIIYRDYYDNNWQPIATNIVYLCTNKFKVYESRMCDDDARYRIQDCGVVQ